MNKQYSSLIAALALLVCFSVVGCIPMMGKAKYTEELDLSVNGAGAAKLDARTTNGNVLIVGSATDQINIHVKKDIWAHTEADAKAFAQEVKVYAEREGDSVRVYYEHPKLTWGRGVSISYNITCPKTLGVKTNTTNGNINIEQIEGSIEGNSTNGNVDLRGGKGSIALSTTNGNIQFHDASGSIDADTTNGNVSGDLLEFNQNGNFSTTNGSIKLTVQKGTAPITASSTNGSVEVKLPADFVGQLDAETSNGRVNSDFPIPTNDRSKKRLKGPIGSGGPAVVQLSTTNGSVNLKKLE